MIPSSKSSVKMRNNTGPCLSLYFSFLVYNPHAAQSANHWHICCTGSVSILINLWNAMCEVEHSLNDLIVEIMLCLYNYVRNLAAWKQLTVSGKFSGGYLAQYGCWWCSVGICTWHVSCTCIVTKPNFNWGTFNMFNVIETLWNYFTC